MANKLEDFDGFVEQLDEMMLKLQLQQHGVGDVGDASVLAMSADAVDTAVALQEIAVANGFAAASVAGDDRPPSFLAEQFRRQVREDLTGAFDNNTEAAGMLRTIGQDLAKLVDIRSKARLKAKSDAAMDKLNRELLARLKEADDSPQALARRFAEQQRAQTDEVGSISDRVAQRADAAERERVLRETDRDD